MGKRRGRRVALSWEAHTKKTMAKEDLQDGYWNSRQLWEHNTIKLFSNMLTIRRIVCLDGDEIEDVRDIFVLLKLNTDIKF